MKMRVGASSIGVGRRVLVTSATQNSGLAAVRELGRAGYEVVTADRRRLPLGLRSRFAVAHYVYPTGEEEEFVGALCRALEESGADALYPLDTTVSGLVAKHRDRLETHAAVLVPSLRAFVTAFDNQRTLDTCRALGVACAQPLTFDEARRRLEAPDAEAVVVKPRIDWGGARGLRYTCDPLALERAVRDCRRRFGEPTIQEFVPGEAGRMRAVLLLFDRDGKLDVWFTTRKLRQWPPSGGITALGVSTREPELVEMVLPFFEHCRWVGPAEVELKIDPRTDRPVVIEINPRFGSYVTLAAACGRDLIVRAMELALGIAAPGGQAEYPTGVAYLNLAAYTRSLVAELCAGDGARGGVLRASWLELCAWRARGVRGPADPAPRVGKLLLQIRELLGGSTVPPFDRRREWLAADGSGAG